MVSSLDSLANLVSELKQITKTSDKLQIIQQYTQGDPTCALSQLLRRVYDSQITFGVRSTAILKYNPKPATEPTHPSLEDLLDKLADRTLSGHRALQACVQFIDAHEDFRSVILSVLDKDLGVGVGVKLLARAIPNLMNTFPDVALGMDLGTTKVDLTQVKPGEWFLSRKYDGVRCIAVYHRTTNQTSYYTRGGKLLTSLGNLELSTIQFASDFTFDPVILDGEIIVNDGSSNEDFNETVSQVRRTNYTIPHPKFMVFDVLTHSEFYDKPSPIILTDRLARIHQGSPNVMVIDQYDAHDHMDSMTMRVKKDKWEGLIARKNTMYQGKRSRDILKIKEFDTMEGVVCDYKVGQIRVYNSETQKYEHVMAVVSLILEDGTDTGSGLSMDERLSFYKEPNLILNKTVSVQYFGKTPKGKLRFPTIRAIYGERRDV